MKRLLSLLMLSGLTAFGGIPQPDILVFGTITIGTNVITSANTGYVVEARRSLTGPAFASYRMGSSLDAGKFFYLLNMHVEMAPTTPDKLSLPEVMNFVVKDGGGVVRGQKTVTLSEAGTVLRMDFGPVVDTNTNGVPDVWDDLFLAGDQSGDRDRDHVSNFAEYVAGTNPNLSNNFFSVSINLTNNHPQISFFIKKAEGVGYENKTRFYSLEARSPVGAWMALSNYDRLVGDNRFITFDQLSVTNAPIFYRGHVWLE